MPKNCIVPFCKSTGKVPDISYFRVTQTRRASWLTALGRNPEEQISPESVLCSRHFTAADILPSGKLKDGAIPTLNLRPEKAQFRRPLQPANLEVSWGPRKTKAAIIENREVKSEVERGSILQSRLNQASNVQGTNEVIFNISSPRTIFSDETEEDVKPDDNQGQVMSGLAVHKKGSTPINNFVLSEPYKLITPNEGHVCTGENRHLVLIPVTQSNLISNTIDLTKPEPTTQKQDTIETFTIVKNQTSDEIKLEEKTAPKDDTNLQSTTNSQYTNSGDLGRKFTIPRSVNQLQPEDFQDPVCAKRSLQFVFDTVKKKNEKIRFLQQKNRRLEEQVESLKELVAELTQENRTLTELVTKKNIKK